MLSLDIQLSFFIQLRGGGENVGGLATSTCDAGLACGQWCQLGL
jgi:hypothetical protein